MPQWRDEALNDRWQKILALRTEVARVLEGARQAKTIGHPLDAQVELAMPPAWSDAFQGQEELLRTVLIVSGVSFVDRDRNDLSAFVEGAEIEGLWIRVSPAEGEKCQRCWVRAKTVGQFDAHPTICHRCHEAVTGNDASA